MTVWLEWNDFEKMHRHPNSMSIVLEVFVVSCRWLALVVIVDLDLTANIDDKSIAMASQVTATDDVYVMISVEQE